MKYEPYEYQDYATKFIQNNEVSAIFLDCGMGKSVITLTAIKNLITKGKAKRVLVIAPLRVANTTWKDELEKWVRSELIKKLMDLNRAMDKPQSKNEVLSEVDVNETMD